MIKCQQYHHHFLPFNIIFKEYYHWGQKVWLGIDKDNNVWEKNYIVSTPRRSKLIVVDDKIYDNTHKMFVETY